MEITTEKPIRSLISKTKARAFSKADWDLFKTEIDKNLEGNFVNLGNTEESCEKVNEIIKIAANKAIPMFTTRNRIEKFPSFIIDSIKLKNYWTRKMTKNPHDKVVRTNVSVLKRSVNIEIQNYRSEKWLKFLNSLGPRPLSTTPIWKRIGRMRNKASKRQMSTLEKEGNVYDTDEKKAEIFKEKLDKVFNENINDNYDKEHFCTINEYINSKSYISEKTSREIPKFTKREMDRAIKKLNRKKSEDSKGISNLLLKNISEKMRVYLLEIFNNILINGKIPKDLKASVVIMLMKKPDDPTNVDNYRPISVTLCIARLLERLILYRIQNILQKIIYQYQINQAFEVRDLEKIK